MKPAISLAALTLALAVAGCGKGSVWNVIEDMNHEGVAHAASVAPAPASQPVLDEKNLPCLKACHDRAKWSKGKPYPHELDTHKDNGKRCVDCHAIGHRSPKADRKICKDCH